MVVGASSDRIQNNQIYGDIYIYIAVLRNLKVPNFIYIPFCDETFRFQFMPSLIPAAKNELTWRAQAILA